MESMDTIYETAGRDKWLVAFERIVFGIDSVLWHCHEEWIIILPVALILAYLSYTLQISSTFPYFTHLPLYDTASSGNRCPGALPLPLHKTDRGPRSAAPPPFASDFTFCPMSIQSPLWRCNTPSHVPARPSPLRKSFTQNDSVPPQRVVASRKTSYFSPLAPFFSEEIAPTSSAILQSSNPCLNMTNTITNTESTCDFNLPFANAGTSSASDLSSRPRCRRPPKKAKSMDNFRTTLFPVLESDDVQQDGSIWGLPKEQQRLQGSRRRWSAL
ncbi:hypothetical protein NliqN6_3744 [Naganishia liquefaciens]|uniref:Uncharacterized protein n=1 Tax=Naganishia liquefaciens TaxID=104408 RepID=A0A8H3YGL4_9TREE|nr:hypothetical protein NliqN6_3744 [Naganishia liquefaciens]